MRSVFLRRYDNLKHALSRAHRPRVLLPRVLFLTPFHFATVRRDDTFDALVQSQLGSTAGLSLVAHHVSRFEAEPEGYEAAQRHAILSSIRQAEVDGYDAVIVGCHYDPALEASRAEVSIPVVGPLQLTTALAAQYGPKFAVVTDVPEAEPVISGLIEGYGLSHACAGVSSVGMDGDTILDDTRAAAVRVDLLVQEVAVQGQAQSVVIGCTIVSAAYEQHRAEFPPHGVRVLNSNLITLQGTAILSQAWET